MGGCAPQYWMPLLLYILVSHIALFYHLLEFRLNVHNKIDRNAIYRIQIFIWGSIYSWDTPAVSKIYKKSSILELYLVLTWQ